MTTTYETAAPARRSVWRFTRHYLEMVLAMLLGMAALYPVWAVATSGTAASSWLHRTDVESLVMATAMSVPMAAWMAHRGHAWRLTAEMCLAMYAGFVLLFPLLWAGALDEMGVMMAGHTLMPLFMLAAMLLRRREYLTHG